MLLVYSLPFWCPFRAHLWWLRLPISGSPSISPRLCGRCTHGNGCTGNALVDCVGVVVPSRYTPDNRIWHGMFGRWINVLLKVSSLYTTRSSIFPKFTIDSILNDHCLFRCSPSGLRSWRHPWLYVHLDGVLIFKEPASRVVESFVWSTKSRSFCENLIAQKYIKLKCILNTSRRFDVESTLGHYASLKNCAVPYGLQWRRKVVYCMHTNGTTCIYIEERHPVPT